MWFSPSSPLLTTTRMKIKLGEILCPWDSLNFFNGISLSLSQRRSFLFKCFLLKIIVIIILMKKKGENDPQLGLDVTQVSPRERYILPLPSRLTGGLLFLENVELIFRVFLHRLPEKLNCIVIWFI